MVIYFLLLGIIYLFCALKISPGWGLAIMLAAIIPIGPFYFKMLLWAENKKANRRKRLP